MLSIVLLLFTAFGVSGQVPSYVPTNGLVGYWPFNGNANDESGNGNNGTVNGATLAADRFGDLSKAYFFDGYNDLIRIAHQAELNLIGDYTISIWFLGNYQNIYNNGWVLIAKRDDNGSCCSPNVPFDVFIPFNATNFAIGAMAYANGGYSFAAPPNSTPVSLDSWENLTIVNSSDNLKFYLNGADYYTTYFSSALRSGNNSDVLIGTVNREFGAEWMNGSLDDIGIWNRALTADEVLALYNGCNVTPQVIAGNATPSAFANSTYTCNNTAGSTYSWSVNNGVIVSGQGTNSITVLWGAEGAGSVSVIETTADGCVGDTVVYDVAVQCVVSGTSITGPVGPEAFSNSTYTCNGPANSTYQWTITNGVIVSGQGTNTVNVLWASTGIGNVSVVETTAEGCVGTTLSQDVVVIPTKVEELSNAFIVYPNPATTELNLQITSDLIGTDLFVFDSLGKQILKQQILSTNTIINTSSFTAGNYVVRVCGGVKKFEVRH